MALTHLVDTSVLTRLSSDAVRAVVDPLIAAGRAARAGISDLEIGFSAQNVNEWESLASSVGVLSLVETSAAHVRRARQTQRLLAEQHLKGLFALMMVVVSSTGSGLTPLFAGLMPCKRFVGLFRVGDAHQPAGGNVT